MQTGLQCESTMPLSGGLRFACGYTVSSLYVVQPNVTSTLYTQMTRAVLGDAIALVRGDRFYTTSYTPVRTPTLALETVSHFICLSSLQ